MRQLGPPFVIAPHSAFGYFFLRSGCPKSQLLHFLCSFFPSFALDCYYYTPFLRKIEIIVEVFATRDLAKKGWRLRSYRCLESSEVVSGGNCLAVYSRPEVIWAKVKEI